MVIKPDEDGLVQCHKCGIRKPPSSFRNLNCNDYRCKDCENERSRNYNRKNREAVNEASRNSKARYNEECIEAFADLISLTKTLKDYHTLTEEEWAVTCSYFDGCALCSDEHIEGRKMFLLAKDGGRYTFFNVIPVCGKCATVGRETVNPYVYFSPKNGWKINSRPDKLRKVQNFIYTALQEALDEQRKN